MIRDIAYFFFQKTCPSCNAAIKKDRLFCAVCNEKYRGEVCFGRLPMYFPAFFVADYTGVTKKTVTRFKFDGISSLGKDIAGEMAKLYRAELAKYAPEVIIPVPSSRKSILKRGYRHTSILAKQLSREVGVRYENALVSRVKNFQHFLDAREREANVSGKITANPKRIAAIKGKRVLILDDLSTTGATLRQSAEAVSKAGAEAVFGIVFASGTGIFSANM